MSDVSCLPLLGSAARSAALLFRGSQVPEALAQQPATDAGSPRGMRVRHRRAMNRRILVLSQTPLVWTMNNFG